MDSNLNVNCNKIFESAGIEPTPVRKMILALIVKLNKKTFSVKDIVAAVKNNKLSIGGSTIIVTFKLFHVRNIIQQLPPPLLHQRAGRPQREFVLSMNTEKDIQ